MHKTKNSLIWKIFFLYLFVSILLLVGINLVIIFNEIEFLGVNSQTISIGITSIIFLICSFVFWIILRSIIRPLHELIANIQGFLEGNWEQRSYIETNDESSLLADEFNILAEEIVSLYIMKEKQLATDTSLAIAPSNSELKQNFSPIPLLISILASLETAYEDKESFSYLDQLIEIEFGDVQICYVDQNPDDNMVEISYSNFIDTPDQEFIKGIINTHEIIQFTHQMDEQMSTDKDKASKPHQTNFAVIPMYRESKKIGSLIVEDNHRSNSFSVADLESLHHLADLIFLILNFRRKEIIPTSQNVYYQKLVGITQQLISSHDLDSILQSTARELHQYLNAEDTQISIKLLDETEKEINPITQSTSGGNGFKR